MTVSLSFKRQVHIGSSGKLNADEPFDEIPQIIRQNQHFEHLSGMDALVIDQLCANHHPRMDKKQPKNIDGIIILGWETLCSENYHYSVSIFSTCGFGATGATGTGVTSVFPDPPEPSGWEGTVSGADSASPEVAVRVSCLL